MCTCHIGVSLRLPHNFPTIITEQGWHLAYLPWILSGPPPPPQMTWQQHKSISIRAFNREFVDSENFKNCMDNRNYIRDVGGLFKQVRGGRLASRVAATNGWKASLLSYRFFSVFLFFSSFVVFPPLWVSVLCCAGILFYLSFCLNKYFMWHCRDFSNFTL